MELETERLVIRPFTADDAADVYAYASKRSIGESAGWPAHASPEESAEILSEWIEDGFKHAIVLKETGAVIGHIAVEPDSEEDREDTAELGFALNGAYHRRGLMSEAVRAVLKYLAANGKAYVWACCFKGNEPSRRLIESLGFTFMQEGEFYSESLEREFESLEYRMALAE